MSEKQTSQDKVCIVIPCYNASLWIKEAIDSALAQTWANVQVIVVDDGSTDGSLEVVKSYGNTIRWVTGANRGGCSARNTGIQLADGEWIQFLDADDTLAPDCVERKMRFPVKSNQIPCCDVVMMGNVKEPLPPIWTEDQHTLKSMLRGGTAQTAAPLHRREALHEVGGFTEGLPCAQEYDLHLRLAIRFDCTFVSNHHQGVFIRKTTNSVSRSAKAKTLMPLMTGHILLKCSNDLLKTGRLTENIEAYTFGVLRNARALWDLGCHEKSLALANRVIVQNPRWYLVAYKTQIAGFAARLIGFKRFEQLRAFFRSITTLLHHLQSNDRN